MAGYYVLEAQMKHGRESFSPFLPWVMLTIAIGAFVYAFVMIPIAAAHLLCNKSNNCTVVVEGWRHK